MASKKSDKPALVNLSAQPVSNVSWISRDKLVGNLYNPNHVAPTELELLITSILADGYTQPIVVLRETVKGLYQIVDGFHRWLTSDDRRLRARYAGQVPIVMIQADPLHRQMSTIRHNRARGVHGVLPMAKIVRGMIDSGVKVDAIQTGLGMEDEEVDRLVDRSGMPKRGSGEKYGKSFIPQGAKKRRKK